MRIFTLLFIVFLLIFSCSTLKYVAPRPNPPGKVEGGYLFEYYAPSANTVVLAGDFNNWEYGDTEKVIKLRKKEDGMWFVVVKLNPGRYKYKFVIDNSKWEKNPYGENAGDSDNNSLIIAE